MGDSTVKLAVLIDADNAQASAVGLLLAEVAKYGTASVKRAYGDWTTMGLKGWKDQLLRQSIQPIQQFAYTQGKNSTDSAMIIDAMDLLYTGKFDGFCIVSSDSDFTRLAARIRESGLIVYGFGERKTPEPFVASCDKFIYIENLSVGKAQTSDDSAAAGVASPARKTHNAPVPATIDSRVIAQLRVVVRDVAGEDGWASLAQVGLLITKRFPDFDSRNYGFLKLRELIVATNKFETKQVIPGEGKPPVAYARDTSYISNT
ncbi:hypothetical protein PG990_010747 [Apiospora arundinis]|uniref:NYN domain-containing protein n=1 Tax=Apiospora arundinis TaxID=335852 RepID=A0ABR2JFJ9_9PEZI